MCTNVDDKRVLFHGSFYVTITLSDSTPCCSIRSINVCVLWAKPYEVSHSQETKGDKTLLASLKHSGSKSHWMGSHSTLTAEKSCTHIFLGGGDRENMHVYGGIRRIRYKIN